MNSAAESLWFLAPGLSHLLGNAVFAIQGRAQLLAASPSLAQQEATAALPEPSSTVVGVEADARAILGGVERAHLALLVLRWLRDEVDQEEVVNAHEVVAAIAEVVRLPLRDRGFRLVTQPAEGSPLWVAPGPFCRLLVAVCKSLTQPLGPATGGELRLSLVEQPDLRLRLGVERIAQTGMLPFSLDRLEIHRALESELMDLQGEVEGDGSDQEFGFVLPQARQA